MKKNNEQQLKAYEAMGDEYLAHKSDPINAIALYNFALAICQDNNKNISFIQSVDTYKIQLIQKIKLTESQFLYSMMSKPVPASDYKLDQAHQEYLKTIRDEARTQLESHQTLRRMTSLQLPAGMSLLDKLYALEIPLECEGLTIQRIYQQVSLQLCSFVRLLIEECKQILGELPCEYSIICFGSLAKDEATPYSDLEFGILIEDLTEKYDCLGVSQGNRI